MSGAERRRNGARGGSDPKGIDRLGTLEEAVLLAIYRLGKDRSYGLALHRALENRIGKSIAIGALYVTLSRLEDKGHVSSATHTGNHGRLRRCYTIEASGVRALNESRLTTQKLWQGLRAPLVVRS